MKKTLALTAVAAAAATFATAASAQSSVTLYGLVDAGLTYVNNVKNLSANSSSVKASSWGVTGGNAQMSRWGLRGTEDLGGSLKTVFTLENGFDVTNGQSLGGQFTRQAYVGLSSANIGTVTLGRQTDAVADYLGPLSATGSWGGTYFAHPGDLDNLDGNAFRVNNSIKFVSANFSGVSFAGAYAFSNAAGSFAANRAYSFGAGYANGPFKLGAAYTQGNGVGANPMGAITDIGFRDNNTGFPVSDVRVRTFGAGGNFSTGALTFGLVWTQSRVDSNTYNADSLIVNNYEANARYAMTPALSLGAAYTFTNGKMNFAGGNEHVRFHQFGLQTDYALSKRTDIYAEGVVQIASGGPEGYTPLAQISGAPSSTSNRQVLVTTGIRHRF